MQIQQIQLGDIKPYDKNAKKHPEKQIKQVARSIEEFGFNQPLVLDKDHNIIVGHGRLEAAKLLGLKEVPCLITSLGEIKAKAYRLADNKLNESDWDMDLVVEELKELQVEDFDITITGFDIDLIIEPDEKDDEVPDVPEEPVSKLGDIYQLGENRVMCGDSTSIEDVEKLMNGEKADLAHNDPPYGMKKEKDGVIGDNMNFDDLLQFNKDWIGLQWSFLKENGSFYCWGIDEPLMDIYSNIVKPLVKEQKATFRNLITWTKFNNEKPTAIESQRSYVNYEEKCLFVMCGVQGFNNNTDNYFEGWENIRSYLKDCAEKVGLNNKKLKEITGVSMYGHWFTKSQWTLIPKEHYKKLQKEYDVFKKEYDEIKKEYDEIKKEYYSTRAYFDNTHELYMTTSWYFKTEKNRELIGGHATPKPISLCERAIKSSCPENGLTIDFFLGSGSTLIACEKTNRKCYGMELDPKYVDVIIQRWEDYTGNKAKKL
jgi:DNA modification methylase|tara:strand:- start:780 stop:2234 length:1455 start_codon:yes stop_codon:yes gene_type:complete